MRANRTSWAGTSHVVFGSTCYSDYTDVGVPITFYVMCGMDNFSVHIVLVVIITSYHNQRHLYLIYENIHVSFVLSYTVALDSSHR